MLQQRRGSFTSTAGKGMDCQMCALPHGMWHAHKLRFVGEQGSMPLSLEGESYVLVLDVWAG